MNPSDVGFAEAFFQFLQASGVGLDGIIILMVMVGFFWMAMRGKLKIGANGMGEDVKAIRSKVQDIDVRLAKVETKVDSIEQYRGD